NQRSSPDLPSKIQWNYPRKNCKELKSILGKKGTIINICVLHNEELNMYLIKNIKITFKTDNKKTKHWRFQEKNVLKMSPIKTKRRIKYPQNSRKQVILPDNENQQGDLIDPIYIDYRFNIA
ncbi:hypothetical protein BB559_005970, partial [Furculomyces boomerangus]